MIVVTFRDFKSDRHHKIKWLCSVCGIAYMARASEAFGGLAKACSKKCTGELTKIRMTGIVKMGSDNGNWKGGISKDNYRYRKIQKLRYPEKDKARTAVHKAIRSGKMNRGSCEVCGEINAHAHHEDYTKPLDVKWLCRKHHREVHDNKH